MTKISSSFAEEDWSLAKKVGIGFAIVASASIAIGLITLASQHFHFNTKTFWKNTTAEYAVTYLPINFDPSKTVFLLMAGGAFAGASLFGVKKLFERTILKKITENMSEKNIENTRKLWVAAQILIAVTSLIILGVAAGYLLDINNHIFKGNWMGHCRVNLGYYVWDKGVAGAASATAIATVGSVFSGIALFDRYMANRKQNDETTRGYIPVKNADTSHFEEVRTEI